MINLWAYSGWTAAKERDKARLEEEAVCTCERDLERVQRISSEDRQKGECAAER